jgi:hypothetical protein
MSIVTNVLLCFSSSEFEDADDLICPPLAKVQAFLERKGHLAAIEAGGYKAMETAVFAGAYNMLDEEGLTECVMSAGWNCGEEVQLLLKRHEDERFNEALRSGWYWP